MGFTLFRIAFTKSFHTQYFFHACTYSKMSWRVLGTEIALNSLDIKLKSSMSIVYMYMLRYRYKQLHAIGSVDFEVLRY